MSLKDYIIFDKDGNIVKAVRCPESMISYQRTSPSDKIIEGVANDSEFQVDVRTKNLIKKQSFNFSSDVRECVADGIDSVTFSGLPVGCQIYVGCSKLMVDDNFDIPDGELIFATNYAGLYTLVFTAQNYKTKRVLINAISTNPRPQVGPEDPRKERGI